MKKLYSRFLDGSPAVGLLILRVVFGAAMVMHGLPKLNSPMHWMDKMPHAAPPLLQGLATAFEVGGGIALILGLLTPLVAIIGLIHFFTAYWMAKRGLPWIASGKSAELPSLYFTVLLAILFTGPGMISLDKIFFGRKR